MSQLPPKEEQPPQDRTAVKSLFDDRSLQGNGFVEQRDRYRKLLNAEHDGQLVRLGQVQPGRAPFQANDRAENLVDGPASELIRTLEDMEAHKLQSAKVPDAPWSDWYWP